MNSLVAGPVASTSYAPQSHAHRGSARCALPRHRRRAAVAAPQFELSSQSEQLPVPHPHSISAITSTSHSGNSSSSPASLAGAGSASSRPLLTSALIAKAVDKAVEEVGAGLLTAPRGGGDNREKRPHAR